MTVCGGLNASQLDNLIRNDSAVESRICEQIMFQLLDELFHLPSPSQASAVPTLENYEPNTLALIISVASVIKVYFVASYDANKSSIQFRWYSVSSQAFRAWKSFWKSALLFSHL